MNKSVKKDVMTVKEFVDQIRKWQIRLEYAHPENVINVAHGISKEMDGYLVSIADRVLAMSKLSA